jgi:hypothetical protein
LKDENVRLDGIINNGGILPTYQKLIKYKEFLIEETIAVHVLAPFKLSIGLLE